MSAVSTSRTTMFNLFWLGLGAMGIKVFRLVLNTLFVPCYLLFMGASLEGVAGQFYDIARTTIQDSTDIRMSKQDTEIARSLSEQSRSKYLPQITGKIEANSNHEHYEDSSSDDYGESLASVSLTQEIINFQRYYEIEGSEQRIVSAQAVERNIVQVVLQEYGVAWAAYWKALRQVDVGEENVSILNKYRENSQIRYDYGELTITDVRLAETRYQGALSQMTRFSRELNRARNVLQEVIRRTAPEDVDLFYLETDEALALRGQETLLEHPAVKVLSEERSAIELDIKQEESGHLPNLRFVSSYDYQFSGDEDSSKYPYGDAKFGLELSIPIYSGGYVSEKNREAVQKKVRKSTEIIKTQEELVRDIESNEFNLEQSFEEITIATQQLNYAQETLAGMIEEFQMGTRSSTDVFLIQADMINAKLLVIQAQEQYSRALINYLYSIGKLSLSSFQKFSEKF